MPPLTLKQSRRLITLLMMLASIGFATLMIASKSDARKPLEPRINSGIQTPSPTPPPIVFKLRGDACNEQIGGVNGGEVCTSPQVAVNAGLNITKEELPSRSASLTATILPTETSNSLQVQMQSASQYPHAYGPAFQASAKTHLTVEVYVRDSPSAVYTIMVKGSSAHNEFIRPPVSCAFGSCGEGAVGSATQMPEFTLYGTASQLGSPGTTFTEFPGATYTLAYKRNPNDWDYVASAITGANGWDEDVGLFADSSLSLNIYATTTCATQIELICRPAPPTRLPCLAHLAKHCYFLISFTDGKKLTVSAFPDPSFLPPSFGDLTPTLDGDPLTPPNGCISDDSDIEKSYCRDLMPPDSCDAYKKLLQAILRGPEGTYSLSINNSNTWIQRRLRELNLNDSLPPSAPSDETTFRNQRNRILSKLVNECIPGLDNRTYEDMIQNWFPLFPVPFPGTAKTGFASNLYHHDSRPSDLPLEVTAIVLPNSFPANQKGLVSIRLKNISTSPVVIPSIGARSQDKYISLEVMHESGGSIVFLNPAFAARALGEAGGTIRLYPGQVISFNSTVNEFGSGFWGYGNPGVASSLQKFTGTFFVRAKFTVDDSNIPSSGELGDLFRGTVLSAPVTILVNAPTSAPATVSGQITTGAGQPLGGVVVDLSGPRSARTITSANGNYRFTSIDPGAIYSVTPSLANFTFSPHNRSFLLVANMTDAAFTGQADQIQTANPLETAEYFVRQQYLDFLNREPDQGGLDYWAGQITQCGADAACIRQRRIGVANAFFFEQEFQKTGAFVYRLYKEAYGDTVPNHGYRPSYTQFSSDRARINAAAAQLAQSLQDLANDFAGRPEFVAKYPASLTAPQFVDAVLTTIQTGSGVSLQSQRDALISECNAGGRGRVLYRLADDNTQNPIGNRDFLDSEYNRAFVLTEYFGYLKRNPDQGGYDFWLNIVNSFPLRDLRGQNSMVCAFITSQEYQQRFSSIVPRSNLECGP